MLLNKFLLLISLIVLVGCDTTKFTGRIIIKSIRPVIWDVYTVSGVVDGDTFDVDFNKDGFIDRSDERCRLIGVDTPELRGWEFYAREAKEETAKLIDRKVIIKFQIPRRDGFGRLLVRVYLLDGTYWNEHLVEEGFGRAWPKNSYVEYEHFMELQRDALINRIGMWSRR